MNNFTYCSPTNFVFGKGCVEQTGAQVAALKPKKALVVYGGGSVIRNGTLARVMKSLEEARIRYEQFGGVRANPEVQTVRAGIEFARAKNVDLLIAVGGGSVIDTSKAIAFSIAYDGDVWDFFCGKAKPQETLPVCVVLTMPAAGSEGSVSCVISNDEAGMKRGVSAQCLRPALAILDPELSFTLPSYQTAAGVCDMIAHILERYFSGVGKVAVTDNICCGIIRALLEAAPAALQNPQDFDARATIMWAGMLAHNDLCGCGRSLSGRRAGGWESHALEHELSALDPRIAHGAGLAVVLPAWMRYVWHEDPSRFLAFAHDVFGISPENESAQAAEKAAIAGIDALQNFFLSLGMPRTLGELAIEKEDVDTLVAGVIANKGKVFGAFKKLDENDVRTLYMSMF